MFVRRYHATLKAVTQSPRLSLGHLIDKLNHVNAVQLNKSVHLDYDSKMKVSMYTGHSMVFCLLRTVRSETFKHI